MKRTTDILILTAVLILTGCKGVSSLEPETGTSAPRPIEFGISSDLTVGSKAVIDNTNYKAHGFTALGVLTVNEADAGRQVFAENTVVTYNTSAASWTYSPLRYWQPGSYVFAGVMPGTGYTATFDAGNTLTLTFADGGFDLASTQTDLMVAFDKETVTSTSAAGPVDFNFAHQMALVTIEGASKDPNTPGITVKEIKVYGNSKKTAGNMVFTYDKTANTFTSSYGLDALSTSTDVYKTITRPDDLTGAAATADWTLAYNTYDVLVPELLVFPQECDFTIVVSYTEGGSQKTMTGTLEADWEAGKKYTYSFSLAKDITFKVNVAQWGSEEVSDGDTTDSDNYIDII